MSNEDRDRVRELVEVGLPARPRYDHTDSTTNELRALGWNPDPHVVYGCGCKTTQLCAGHADRRAVEHYNPEWAPPVSKVSGNVRIARAVADQMTDVHLEKPIEQAWIGWFRELRRAGLRPVGWPMLHRAWIALPQVYTDDHEHGALVVPEDSPHRDELRLIVESRAVPS